MPHRIADSLAALAVAALLATTGACSRGPEPGRPAVEHEAGHDGHAAAGLTLNHGARWSTDAPLRDGMRRIRDTVASAHAARPAGGLSREAAAALAGSVRADVAFLVANCKLEPQADATLHVLIGEMLAGAGALEQDPASAAAMSQLVGALHEYPNYFDHPGWVPIEGGS